MTSIQTDPQIAAYVAAVEAALADLPADDREELVEDLPLHLADVLADGTVSLRDRLGEPSDYAAELRAAAGLDAPPRRPDWQQALRERLGIADARIGSAFGYARFGDLVRALAPAWWVLRAYLVVQLASHATSRAGWRAGVPRVGDSLLVGLLVLAIAILGSVWIGRRMRGGALWGRALALAAALALAGYTVVLAHHLSEAPTQITYTSYDQGPNIQNIYPYDTDGTPLKNVRLFDQDGNPVTFGDPCSNVYAVVGQQDGQYDNPDDPSSYTYPLSCPSNPGPFPSGVNISPLPSTPAAATPTPAPTPSPIAPTPTPTR